MLGLILGGLGSAATAAGMGTLGAGLTAAGTAIGGVPGLGGSGLPGLGGVGPGAGAPGSMPFGFDITKLINPASENLGTTADGWSTTVTPAASAQGGALPKAPIPSSPLPGASAPMQKPVDIQQLLSIINGRAGLGS